MTSPQRGGLVAGPGQIEELTTDECWTRLRSGELGRLAIIVQGRPEVFPMNYAVSGDRVLFRTAPGSKLTHGPASVATFEIDGYETTTGSGWSVVVQGPLEEMTGRADTGAKALPDLPVHPYAAGPKEHVLVLQPTRVTGRHFTWGPLAPSP